MQNCVALVSTKTLTSSPFTFALNFRAHYGVPSYNDVNNTSSVPTRGSNSLGGSNFDPSSSPTNNIWISFEHSCSDVYFSL